MRNQAKSRKRGSQREGVVAAVDMPGPRRSASPLSRHAALEAGYISALPLMSRRFPICEIGAPPRWR